MTSKNKAPAMMFYGMDWMRDLEEYTLEIEGAWIRIVIKLHFSDTKGSLTRNLDQWARILRVDNSKALRILNTIKEEKIGNVTFCHDQNNGDITIECRRMLREERAREQNRIRQKRHRKTGRYNADVTPPVTGMLHRPSSSYSSSVDISTYSDKQETPRAREGRSETGSKKNAGGPTDPDRPPERWTAEDIKAKAWEVQETLGVDDNEVPAITDLVCNHFSRINPALTATRDRMQAAQEGTQEPIENVMAYFTTMVKEEEDV